MVVSLPKERPVIGANGAMHIVGQQLVHGVSICSRCEPQNLVGNRAQLQADALGLHVLHNIRMLCQGKAMPYALRPQQKSVDQIAIRVGAHIQRLAAVEQEGDIELLLGALFLEFEQFGDKGLDRIAWCLFTNKVKPYKKEDS